MKKLLLVRHAKSSWYKFHIKDYDRPLNDRGEENSIRMGKYIQEKNILPDTIITSGSKRAKTTAKNLVKAIDFHKELVINDAIYDANTNDLYSVLDSFNNDDETIILIGHNPSLTLLAYDLVGFDQNIPTSGIVEIDCDTQSWKKISPSNSKLVSFEYPKKNN